MIIRLNISCTSIVIYYLDSSIQMNQLQNEVVGPDMASVVRFGNRLWHQTAMEPKGKMSGQYHCTYIREKLTYTFSES